jgi:hypothetical protein
MVFAVLLVNLPLMAQEDDSADTEDVTELDLFDDDTEKTKQGWVQFYASIGITYLDADGRFGVRTLNGDYFSIINFDRAGLDETDESHWLTFNWRSANSRWGAWFGSWRYDVTGSREWEKEFEIPGKDPIPVGASVSTNFDAKWYILEATYSFYRTETVDTGIGFGLHTVDLDTTISAQTRLGDGNREVVSERLDVLAPLPNVLAYLYWKFAPQWSLVGRVGWFGMDYDDYSGRMINSHTMVNYEFSSRWSLGFGYQFVDLDLDVDKTNYVQIYEVDFSGPMAYLRFSF